MGQKYPYGYIVSSMEKPWAFIMLLLVMLIR